MYTYIYDSNQGWSGMFFVSKTFQIIRIKGLLFKPFLIIYYNFIF